MRRRRRWILPALVAGALVFGTGVVTGLPAAADPVTTVTGHAYLGSGNHPAEAGEVRISWARPDAPFDDAQSVLTQATGVFTISGLDTGTWELQSREVTGSPQYGVATTEINVSADPVTVRVTVPRLVNVTGTAHVGDASRPAAAGQVTVTAFELGSEDVISSATTDAMGAYSLWLPGGDAVRLRFSVGDGRYVTTWWKDAYSEADALRVNVPSFDPLQVGDEVLPLPGTLRGAVDVAGLKNIDLSELRIDVVAHLLKTDGSDAESLTTSTSAAVGWAYSFPSLPVGSYHLQFTSAWLGLQPWLDSTALLPGGRTVTVSAGTDTVLSTYRIPLGMGIYTQYTCWGCGNPEVPQTRLDVKQADGSWAPALAGTYRSTTYTGEFSYWQLLPGTYRVTLAAIPGKDCAGLGPGPAITFADGTSPSGGDFTLHCLNPLQHTTDFSGDRTADLMAVDPGGALVDYDADGAFHWRSQAAVNYGWQGMTVIPAHGFATGSAPLLAIKPDGSMWLYPIDNGVFGTPKLVCVGWGGLTNVISDGDWTGDGKADVLAIDGAGHMLAYPGDGAGGVSSPHVIGSGWVGFTAVIPVGDFDGDGHADIVARTSDGRLFLYRGDGNGGWLGIQQIGAGFQIFSTMTSIGDYTGDGTVDLMARDTLGRLWVYPADTNHNLGYGTIIGAGWNSMRISQ